MTSPEALYTKNAINKHGFPLVTHTVYFDTRFGRYGFLNLGFSVELFLSAWTLEQNPSFKHPNE
jgi:hypothetical protein